MVGGAATEPALGPELVRVGELVLLQHGQHGRRVDGDAGRDAVAGNHQVVWDPPGDSEQYRVQPHTLAQTGLWCN